MSVLNIRKDGCIKATDLETLFEALLKVLRERLDCQDKEIKTIRAELETERRLRLAMRR